MIQPIYEVRQLSKLRPLGRGRRRTAPAVGPFSLSLHPGECLALLSGSGEERTLLARLLSGLTLPDSGEFLLGSGFASRPGSYLSPGEGVPFHPKLRLLPHNPQDFFPPRRTVFSGVEWPLELLGETAGPLRRKTVLEALRLAGVPAGWEERLPGELSPAQMRRAGLARALASDPQVLICDEPFYRLTPVEAAGLAARLELLRRERGISLLLITGELPLACQLADRVGVFCGGLLVELAEPHHLTGDPLHPCTRLWLGLTPSDAPVQAPQLGGGVIPGCSHRTRCPSAIPLCGQLTPTLGEKSPGHWVACHLFAT